MPGRGDGAVRPGLRAACPTDGEGSFAGMADDPAATAASNNPELSTLVAAVSAAGLVDTLNGEGPFTIFAPANSAFAKVPAADLDALLADPTGALTDILTIHVVAGESLSSADLVEAGTVDGPQRRADDRRRRRRRHGRRRWRSGHGRVRRRARRQRHRAHHRHGAAAGGLIARDTGTTCMA